MSQNNIIEALASVESLLSAAKKKATKKKAKKKASKKSAAKKKTAKKPASKKKASKKTTKKSTSKKKATKKPASKKKAAKKASTKRPPKRMAPTVKKSEDIRNTPMTSIDVSKRNSVEKRRAKALKRSKLGASMTDAEVVDRFEDLLMASGVSASLADRIIQNVKKTVMGE